MPDVAVRVPFDIERERLFCARCGRQCVESGHMLSRFLMCPTHGEFTIAPVVIFEHARDDWFAQDPPDTSGQWTIVFHNETEKSMWDTCRYVDAEGLGGNATRTG